MFFAAFLPLFFFFFLPCSCPCFTFTIFNNRQGNKKNNNQVNCKKNNNKTNTTRQRNNTIQQSNTTRQKATQKSIKKKMDNVVDVVVDAEKEKEELNVVSFDVVDVVGVVEKEELNVVSFDVGIENLAFCHFLVLNSKASNRKATDSKAKENRTVVMVNDWQVVNIGKSQEEMREHEHMLNLSLSQSCSCCEKPGKYATFDGASYYCTTHAKNAGYKLMTNALEAKLKKRKKLKMVELITLLSQDISKGKGTREDKDNGTGKDKGTGKETSKEKGKKRMTKEQLLLELEGILQNEYVYLQSLNSIENRVKTTNAIDIPILQLARNLTLWFDTFFSGKTIDVVLIENQIGPLAVRMKSIQSIITTYFVIRFPQCQVKDICSSHKLENQKTTTKATKGTKGTKATKGKEDYDDRKQLSVETCQNIIMATGKTTETTSFSFSLEVSEFFQELFQKQRYKDDLADAFLQGLWFLQQKMSCF